MTEKVDHDSYNNLPVAQDRSLATDTHENLSYTILFSVLTYPRSLYEFSPHFENLLFSICVKMALNNCLLAFCASINRNCE